MLQFISIKYPFLVQDIKDMVGDDEEGMSKADLEALKAEWLTEMKANMKVVFTEKENT